MCLLVKMLELLIARVLVARMAKNLDFMIGAWVGIEVSELVCVLVGEIVGGSDGLGVGKSVEVVEVNSFGILLGKIVGCSVGVFVGKINGNVREISLVVQLEILLVDWMDKLLEILWVKSLEHLLVGS